MINERPAGAILSKKTFAKKLLRPMLAKTSYLSKQSNEKILCVPSLTISPDSNKVVACSGH